MTIESSEIIDEVLVRKVDGVLNVVDYGDYWVDFKRIFPGHLLKACPDDGETYMAEIVACYDDVNGHRFLPVRFFREQFGRYLEVSNA